MPIEQLVVLAIVQGLTEFLPVSSSGHLNLVHALTDWRDQGALMDVAVHVGSLFAVLIYFWRDVITLITGALKLLTGRLSGESRLLLLLALATLPVGVIGLILLETGLVAHLRTAEVVAWANIVFAVVLYWADRVGALTRRLENITLSDAATVGLAQVLALVPGVSRSGITMSMARYLGYERREAARFASLLAIPTIAGFGLASAIKLAGEGDGAPWGDVMIGAGLSFLAAFISIWFMMALLKRVSMTPFVVYRIVLGLVLLGWIYV